MSTSLVVERIREIVDAARPGTRIPPIDCTNNCGLGPCDCSGEWRVMDWAIDVPRLRQILAEATLLRAYQDSAACASGKERPLDAELGAGARTPHQPAPADIDDREWVAWGFANLTLLEAIRRLRAVNADREARGEQQLGEPPFTGEGT